MVTVVLADSKEEAQEVGIVETPLLRVSTPGNVASLKGLRVDKIAVFGAPTIVGEQYRMMLNNLYLSEADRLQINRLKDAYIHSLEKRVAS